jgi:aspartyl-tRNA(Asn)/glutamyl-tRNA(Gln) amidotransferase subunit A
MSLSLIPNENETISGSSKSLRAGQITCVGLVERCLEKIDEWEPTVKAWVTIAREAARARAAELDRMLKSGHDLGPLHGIPIGVKDIVDVAGFETTAGAKTWSKGLAHVSHPLVDNLISAGAIILGKTVTTTYAFLDPPPTRNPWNLERTPGGSSSGSAAAVATGMCLGAIGTQTVGSLTRPASFCGVSSRKPTKAQYRSYPRMHTAKADELIMPLAPFLDMPGLMTKSVHDLELMFESISIGCTKGQESAEAPQIRVLLGPFRSLATPEIRSAISRAVELWQAAGAVVDEVDLPDDFEAVWPTLRTILAYQTAGFHGPRMEQYPEDYLPKIRGLVETGRVIGELDLRSAEEFRERVDVSLDELSRSNHAVFITPASLGAAPGLDSTGDAVFNGPWNFLDKETISFPIGLSDDDMPLAVQLVFPRAYARNAFETAKWCERVIQNDLRKEQG